MLPLYANMLARYSISGAYLTELEDLRNMKPVTFILHKNQLHQVHWVELSTTSDQLLTLNWRQGEVLQSIKSAILCIKFLANTPFSFTFSLVYA